MSGYICPHCGDITNIFGRGGGEEFCRIETEKARKEQRRLQSTGGEDGTESTPASGAKELRFLGRVPVDSEFVKVVDGPGEGGLGLLERYLSTQSSKLLGDITGDVISLVGRQRTAMLSETSPRENSAAVRDLSV